MKFLVEKNIMPFPKKGLSILRQIYSIWEFGDSGTEWKIKKKRKESFSKNNSSKNFKEMVRKVTK
jgi:hypothetical protein